MPGGETPRGHPGPSNGVFCSELGVTSMGKEPPSREAATERRPFRPGARPELSAPSSVIADN